MKEHYFSVILLDDPTDTEAERLYGVLNDGTISTIDGTAQVSFHREASSLEEAIRSAVSDIRSVGIEVRHIEMQPDTVPA